MSSDLSALRRDHPDVGGRSARRERCLRLREQLVSQETWLRRYIQSRLGGFPVRGVDCEDVLQEAFSRAVGALPTFRTSSRRDDSRGGVSDGGLRPWLGRIVENHLCDLVRAQQRFASLARRGPHAVADRVFDVADACRTGSGLLERVIAPALSPSAAMLRSESLDFLRICLERLSECHREVVRLKVLEDRSPAEISRSMKRSKAAVRMLYVRAMEHLVEIFHQEYEARSECARSVR